MELAEYRDRFRTAVLNRDEAGVLTSRDGPLVWGAGPHRELAKLFGAVAADRDSRIVVLTGTGDTFVAMPEPGPEVLARGGQGPSAWDHTIWEANRLIGHLLDIEVPVIAAVNGPVSVHSELGVLADIVLCTPETFSQDAAHFVGGLVPGDGMQVVSPLLLGPNRGRSSLLTDERLGAAEAERRGVVAEVLAPDQLLARAYDLAAVSGSEWYQGEAD